MGHKSSKEKGPKFIKVERNIKVGGEITIHMERYATSQHPEFVKKKIIKKGVIGKIDLFEKGRRQELR